MEKQTARFILRPGLIMMHGESKQFSQHSSEEELIYLLSKHPQHIKNFERFPDNWKEIVSEAYPAVKVEEVEEAADSDTEETTAQNPRVAELEAMKAQDLKALIVSKGLEVPQGNKGDLVAFILKAEA
jgi:hypothetical protein